MRYATKAGRGIRPIGNLCREKALLPEWDRNREDRAFSGTAFDFNLAAEQLGIPFHDKQS